MSFVYAVNDWTRLDRFLVLGCEGGSYYATERKLSRLNTYSVLRCVQDDGRVVGLMEWMDIGVTDCSLPMLHAMDRNLSIDAFVIVTGSDTWAGQISPAEALRAYRAESKLQAKLAVVGLVSNGFTLADPDDSGMLDVVGFDTATPQVLADFARGGDLMN